MEKRVIDLTGDPSAVRELLSEMNVVDIADQIEELYEEHDEGLSIKLFRLLPKDMAADVFAYLSREMQQYIVEAITDREISGIIDELFLDDAVDFIEEMPAGVVKRVLSNVSRDKRDKINLFLNYPENSAGSVMTIEYVDLKSGMTVKEAISHIRETGVNKETIYTCYVIDRNRKLVGALTVRELLLARDDELVGDIMARDVISASTADDRESVILDIRKYGFLAMPIVDHENRLVGIITVDDALEVQEEETTEDFELMAAMSPYEDPYLKTSVWRHTKNRVPWLMLLMLSATLTGAIISGFEDALAVLPALVAYIPMLMGTGGNAGAQSSTLIIRGMAIEEIEISDILTILWKEIRVAVMCGAVLVAVNFCRIVLMGGDATMALTISCSLYSTVILAKLIGSMLPIAAKKLRLDPAVMASPAITTIVDATSLIMYFSFAKLILGI